MLRSYRRIKFWLWRRLLWFWRRQPQEHKIGAVVESLRAAVDRKDKEHAAKRAAKDGELPAKNRTVEELAQMVPESTTSPVLGTRVGYNPVATQSTDVATKAQFAAPGQATYGVSKGVRSLDVASTNSDGEGGATHTLGEDDAVRQSKAVHISSDRTQMEIVTKAELRRIQSEAVQERTTMAEEEALVAKELEEARTCVQDVMGRTQRRGSISSVSSDEFHDAVYGEEEWQAQRQQTHD